MLGLTLRRDLFNILDDMHEQGILDNNFDNIMRLQSPGFNPSFVAESISMYIRDAAINMAAMTNLLNADVVNFGNLRFNVRLLEATSGIMGGRRLAGVCFALLQACDAQDQERCRETFARVKVEHQTLSDNLKHIRELMQSILSYESRLRSGL